MYRTVCMSGFRKTHFLKTQPTGFLGLGLYWVFWICYLNKQLRSLLVDFAHLLSFFLDTGVHYVKICKFVTYWSLQAVNIKKSLIFKY